MGHKHRPAPHPSPSWARPSPRMRGEGFTLALLARLRGQVGVRGLPAGSFRVAHRRRYV